MSSRSASLSQLWQVPLLLLSLGLFGYAAYLLWDPKPGPTVDQRLADVRALLRMERPEAAVAELNKLIKLDKLTPEQQSKIHLMFAESLEMYQDQRKQVIPVLMHRIIEQTRLAIARGPIDGSAYRRMASAYEKLGRPVEALENYKRAQSLDPDRAMRLARKIVDLELDRGNTVSADVALQEYLKDPKITDAERAWALAQRAKILTDNGKYVDARLLLDQALKLTADSVQEGEINYGLGYIAFKLGEDAEAERFLRVAREQMQSRHPLDADACLLLGKIYQSRNRPEEANSFFEHVIVNMPDAKVAPLAQLGRAMCRAMMKQDEPALADLVSLAKQVDERPSRAKFKDEVIAGIQQASTWMALRGNLQGALELLAHEHALNPNPSAEFFTRLAGVYEKRAKQIEDSIAPHTPPAERIKAEQQVRELRTKAGDGYIAYGQKVAVNDDKAYGDALWHGIDLYDRAGNTAAAISAMELFITERPEDAATPDALLRLGRAYQSIGQVDKAIAAYQKNQLRYPKSLAASKSAVPLAQALVAKGPDSFGRAENVLLSVLDNNPLLDPTSEDFRQALFDLGQLYYRTQRYEECVVKLEEFIKRYPTDERLGQLLFLMGDSYRKSAQQLQQKLATASNQKDPGFDPAEMEAARQERLRKAKAMYDRVVELYRDNVPARDTEKLYYKLAHFYRGDCLYDLGEYEAAIKLYDNAAFRFQDDPSSLAAYVQIVNAWCRLGKTEQAKAANERAKWVLRKIPPQAFNDGSFSMPKEYWEQWLRWANESGMW